jgi:hypothetical protein
MVPRQPVRGRNFRETWQVLRAVLQGAGQPLTQREILREWLEDLPDRMC